MNTNTIQLLAQIVMIFGGGYFAAHHLGLTQTDVQGVIAGLAAITGVVWKLTHFNAATAAAAAPNPQTVPITKGNNLMGNAPLFLACLLPLAFAGCASNPAVVGHVVSVTDRGFGINIQTASSPNSTPTVKLGFFSQTVFIEPVATNATLETPAVANTFALDNTGSPFTFGVNETIASEDYQTGSPTNGVAAQPIIPK